MSLNLCYKDLFSNVEAILFVEAHGERAHINAHEVLCLHQHLGCCFHCGTVVMNSLKYSKAGF